MFDFYFSLYKKDMSDPLVCRDCVDEACARYPYNDEVINHALFLSDRKRRLWNAWRNLDDANGRQFVVLVECEKDDDGRPKIVPGCSQQQTDMYLYLKQELIGYTRKSTSIVNGVIYIVEAIAPKSEACPDGSVSVRMHEEYSPLTTLLQDGSLKEALRPYLAEVQRLLRNGRAWVPHALSREASRELQDILKNRIGRSELVRWTCFARLFPEVLVLEGDKIRLRTEEDEEDEEEAIQDVVTLTHAEASDVLRMTYAFAYYSVQGATLRDRHVALFDTRHRRSYFTLRHLIVGMSRATHGKFVHVLSAEQEELLMTRAGWGE